MVTGPSRADTGRSQDERARPPTSTNRAPHSPIPQPNSAPQAEVMAEHVEQGVSGSQVTLRSAPFTVSRNPDSLMQALQNTVSPGVP